MGIHRIVLLDLALLALIILGSRGALLLHELVGHALPAWALGARHFEIRMSGLGGGYVNPAFPPGRKPPAWGTILFSLGGILVNFLTGAAAWIAARRLRTRGLIYVALLFFGVGSVGGALVYLSNGFYYGSGDPVGLAPESEDISRAQWIWTLFVPAGCAVAWMGGRHYADFLSGFMNQETAGRRWGGLLLTVGLAALSYGGLWLFLRNTKVEGSTAQWRLEREIEKEEVKRTAANPEASSLPVAPAPSPPLPRPSVRPEEVSDRVPPPVGPLVLYGAGAGAALLGLWRVGSPAREPGSLPPFRVLALVLLATGVVLSFLFAGS